MTATAYDDLVPRLRGAGCVFAEDEARLLLDEAEGDRLDALVSRRLAGEPLEHVVGWVDFAGVRVGMDRGVFIPRRRTALLVEVAGAAVESWLAASPPRPAAVVVDLCCGSGALGLALAARHPGIELHASDSDPAAVACARRNLEPVGGTVHHGDLDASLPDRLLGRVDVLVANVPYVPTAAIALMPADSRGHEPRSTVDGGPDGLDVLRRLAARAPRWLAPGGRVLVEVGTDQAAPAVAVLEAAGSHSRVHRDAGLCATVVEGEPA